MTLQGSPELTSPLSLSTMQEHYAEILIRVGVNLQPGQSLVLSADVAHAEFARLVVASAYRHGARFVHVLWRDEPVFQARVVHSNADFLDYVPDFDVVRLRQQLDEGWASLHLVGAAFPGLLDDLEPAYVRRARLAFRRAAGFYQDAVMAHRLAWSIGAVPTPAWAQQIFPDLAPDEAVDRLWRTILRTVRADHADPIDAWLHHDAHLRSIAATLQQRGVASLHFLDVAPGPDGLPSTDFVIGLTESPVWIAASSETPQGVRFVPNIPTEELFTTPHSGQAEGYVRTTKPAFVFGSRVDDAYFRFTQGEAIEYDARHGLSRLQDMFSVPGANRLGEVALVDVRSPVNESGLVFHETLFDENCVCHIAFGKAYASGLANGPWMTADELIAAGVNESEVHVDFMIGSPTLQVTGLGVDGSRMEILRDGKFTEALLSAHDQLPR